MASPTHIYIGTKEPTYYIVSSRSFFLFSINIVHFWDKYQGKWVRSYCYPPIKEMVVLR